jgi:penicillin-binding protein 2
MRQHKELKDHLREIYFFRLRLVLSFAFMLTLAFLLFTRLVYLQIFRQAEYSTMADKNRISVVPIVPNRGLIQDRNGVTLARNYSGYTLEISPSKVSNLENTINELSTLVDIQPMKWRVLQHSNFVSPAWRSRRVYSANILTAKSLPI